LIAKYSACKWDMADGYTDTMQGVPSAAGQAVRAVSDSGYGSSVGNAMEMINWHNTDSGSMGTLAPAVMRIVNGRRCADFSAADCTGLSCRKTVPLAAVQPNPRNRIPYTVGDAHFTIAALSVPGAGNSGVAFQASLATHVYASQLTFTNSQPQARWTDPQGTALTLTSPTRLVANAPAVVSMTSVAGAQRLRVNSAVVGSGSTTFGMNPFDQILIGWGFQEYFPRPGFGGNVYAVITGSGAPTAAELQVMENYLASIAGV
jgi:hypothetical protein